MPRTKAIALAGMIVLSLASCATVRTRVSGDPLAALGTCDARDGLYVVVPVRKNEGLVSLAEARLAGKPGESRVARRLDVLYLAVSRDAAGSRRARFVATGNIPKSGARLYLTEERGWSRRSETGFSWYRSGPLAVAIPSSGVACGIVAPALRDGAGEDGDSKAMVSLVDGLAGHDPVSLEVSRSFAQYAGNARRDGRIGFFSPDPAIFMGAILGPEVSLPIRAVEGYATPGADGNYELSVSFSLSDPRSARALRGLLSRVFAGATLIADGDAVSVDGYCLSREKLAAAIDFLYLVEK